MRKRDPSKSKIVQDDDESDEASTLTKSSSEPPLVVKKELDPDFDPTPPPAPAASSSSRRAAAPAPNARLARRARQQEEVPEESSESEEEVETYQAQKSARQGLTVKDIIKEGDERKRRAEEAQERLAAKQAARLSQLEKEQQLRLAQAAALRASMPASGSTSAVKSEPKISFQLNPDLDSGNYKPPGSPKTMTAAVKALNATNAQLTLTPSFESGEFEDELARPFTFEERKAWLATQMRRGQPFELPFLPENVARTPALKVVKSETSSEVQEVQAAEEEEEEVYVVQMPNPLPYDFAKAASAYEQRLKGMAVVAAEAEEDREEDAETGPLQTIGSFVVLESGARYLVFGQPNGEDESHCIPCQLVPIPKSGNLQMLLQVDDPCMRFDFHGRIVSATAVPDFAESVADEATKILRKPAMIPEIEEEQEEEEVTKTPVDVSDLYVEHVAQTLKNWDRLAKAREPVNQVDPEFAT